MIPDRKQVTADYPWIPPDAIRWLDETLRPSWTVLETGMGGSTLFFAKRCALVISYESSATYFDKTTRLIVERGYHNVEGRYRRGYPSGGLGVGGDSPPSSIDLAFIDGRGRVRSVIDVVEHIRPGGWLVLDDSQRERYVEAVRVADQMSSERLDFSEGDDRTTAWRISAV